MYDTHNGTKKARYCQVEFLFSNTKGLRTIFYNKQYLIRLLWILLTSGIVYMVTSFVFSSYYRGQSCCKSYFSNSMQTTTLFPPSSSINNDHIMLSVTCDYTMTCFKSILFHSSRVFMKCIYSSSAARKKNSYIMLLSVLAAILLPLWPPYFNSI